MKHDHYFIDVSAYDKVDVYRLLELFDVTCPVAQHVIKKALKAGKRGHKNLERDWVDIVDSAQRKLDMLIEDDAAAAVVGPGDFEGVDDKTSWSDDWLRL